MANKNCEFGPVPTWLEKQFAAQLSPFIAGAHLFVMAFFHHRRNALSSRLRRRNQHWTRLTRATISRYTIWRSSLSCSNSSMRILAAARSATGAAVYLPSAPLYTVFYKKNSVCFDNYKFKLHENHLKHARIIIHCALSISLIRNVFNTSVEQAEMTRNIPMKIALNLPKIIIYTLFTA